MQNFKLTLASPVATSFRATKAANSLDIDAEKKSVHHFEVQADLDSPFNNGLIVGASGSGKTTLAKHIYGDDCFKEILDMTKPVIDQFPESMTYDECAAMLCGVGLTAVPCWIRPAFPVRSYDCGLSGTGFERCYVKRSACLCASMRTHGQRVGLALRCLCLDRLGIVAAWIADVALCCAMLVSDRCCLFPLWGGCHDHHALCRSY